VDEFIDTLCAVILRIVNQIRTKVNQGYI